MFQANLTHRIGRATIKVSDSSKPVKIKQTRHKFLFGCGEFSTLPFVSKEMDEAEYDETKKRLKHMTDIFNSVTLPFYWGSFEPEQGKPDTNRMMKAAKWLGEKGITLKGHPLCWHTVSAPWLMEMTNDEIYKLQIARIHRDVSEFSGVINMWDVVNEAVIMPIYNHYDNAITRICKERGRVSLIKDLFKAAREANPNATMLINDYETYEPYSNLIDELLDADVKIDAIGIQSHMHQGSWSQEHTDSVLERFARFGLPLHFTELSMISGQIMPKVVEGDFNDYRQDSWPSTPEGEARQAKEAIIFYDKLFAHPLVESITWWCFKDGLWLDAPTGLVSRDSDIKPSIRSSL